MRYILHYFNKIRQDKICFNKVVKCQKLNLKKTWLQEKLFRCFSHHMKIRNFCMPWDIQANGWQMRKQSELHGIKGWFPYYKWTFKKVIKNEDPESNKISGTWIIRKATTKEIFSLILKHEKVIQFHLKTDKCKLKPFWSTLYHL